MRQATRSDYHERLNRVIDHIQTHLDGPLSTERLARIAAFSPFHFHRIFQSLTGETLGGFIQRVRLEKAVFLLTHRRHMPVKAIAAECGFQSASVFSRAFSEANGFPPSRFDRREWQKRRNRNAWPLASSWFLRDAADMPEHSDFRITVRPSPALSVAYIRVLDPYRCPAALPAAWSRLKARLEADKLDPRRLRMIGMSIDDPEVTPLENCRYDCGFIVPDPAVFTPSGEAGLQHLPAGLHAVLECNGDIRMVDEAWNHLFKCWLPASGFLPVHQPALEIYHSPPAPDGSRFHLDCCLAVEPIRRSGTNSPPDNTTNS